MLALLHFSCISMSVILYLYINEENMTEILETGSPEHRREPGTLREN